MAGSRTLKLSILADIDNLQKNLKKANGDVENFGDKLTAFGKKAALAFAAFGAAALAASINFAKAAAQDQQSANRLAETLKAVTGATNAQIAAVEKYITKTSLATGITDDQLRPSFERLARSAKNVNDAQNLLNLSLDLAAASGKPLESVTNALAKAYDGNFTSLNRLGLGIDQSSIKAKDFDGVYKQLNSTFGNFSENASQQAIVKFQRLQVAMQEAKEQIGAALLPLFIRLGDWLLKTGVPNLQAFVDGLTGQRGVTVAIDNANKGAADFGEKLRKMISWVIDMKEELAALGAVIAAVFVASKVAAFVTAIQGLVGAFVAWRTAAAGAAVATAAATGGISVAGAAAGIAAAIGLLAGAGIFLKGGDSGLPANLGTAGTLGPVGGSSSGGGSSGLLGSFGSLSSGGGGGGTSAQANGATTKTSFYSQFESLKGVPIIDALLELDKGLRKTNRQLEAGTISPYVAQQRLDEFMAMRDTLVAQSKDYRSGITINVNAPSAIDENGFARAVVDALNSVERRQAGGSSALIGL